VKSTGRDEPIGVVIHICMETTQGISLYNYLYLKLAKPPFFSMFYVFCSTKSENTSVGQVLPGEGGVGIGGSAEVMEKGFGV
jgi:hypothetical protein